MTIKKLFLLGSVIAGAAYLQNKSRRERLMDRGRDLLDKAKSRASDVAQRIEQRREGMGSDTSDFGTGTNVGIGSPGYGS